MDYELNLVPDDSEVVPFLYHDRELIIPASNELGQTTGVSFNAPPDLIRLVSELVESRQFPWRTNADCHRWLTVEGLRSLKRYMPWLIPDMRRVEAMIEYLQSERRKQDHLKMLEVMEDTVRGWVSLGAESEARRVITNIAERIREWEGEENSWIRDETVRRMSKYAHLFKDDVNPLEGV